MPTPWRKGTPSRANPVKAYHEAGPRAPARLPEQRANVVGKAVECGIKDRLAYWEEIQCNHCRLNLNYPKGIASRCQPSQQFENWCLLGDNCLRPLSGM